MNPSQNRSKSNKNVVFQKGQQNLLSGNKESHYYPSLSSNPVLSKDTLDALEDLGEVLKCIHKRMISEGYVIIDGVVKLYEEHKNKN